ncbi:MAG: SDR family oxidoreductase [Spirochaetota bacterium]
MARALSQAFVVVTGASRGIGRAIALELAEAGASLLLVARNGRALQDVAREVSGRGGAAQSLAVDLTRDDATKRVYDAAAAPRGRIDLLVNNAGIALGVPFVETGVEVLRDHLRINLEVPFLLTQALVPLLEAAARLEASDDGAATGAAAATDAAATDAAVSEATPRHGEAVIINISSVVGHKGYENQSAYSASKHALLGFTKAAGKELRHRGIRMHAVSPGGTATDMIAGVRPDLDPQTLIQPQAVARTVRFIYEMGDGAAVDEVQLRRSSGTPWA